VKPFELICFNSADELARAVAGRWLADITESNRAGRSYHVALSGGRVAPKLFTSAAEQAKGQALLLKLVHFFWADERCVPPDDAESNYLPARNFLFRPLGIPDNQVHRVPGELPPQTAADQAGEDIRRVVPLNKAGQPVLDLVLLGLGEDGHIASLFPGEPEPLKARESVYRAVKNSPKPPPDRVTLGYPAIVAAKQVWVLVSGTGKEQALRQSLELSGQTPLAHVLKFRRETMIFTDIEQAGVK
jgi:6-phosphogluconolactonase